MAKQGVAAHADVTPGISYLGTHTDSKDLGGEVKARLLPKFYYGAYLRIFNNYFKIPYNPDIGTGLSQLSTAEQLDGFACSQLDSFWTKSLPPDLTTSSLVQFNNGLSEASDGFELADLQTAAAKLRTTQERELFMQRYRDVINNFGGSTHYDADQRPHLLMRSNLWASGYDVDGTDQTSLGQFSGRVQQPFNHTVPRFYVPEHGVIMTLMLVRFPVVHAKAMNYLASKASLNYYDIVNDPVMNANLPPRKIPVDELFVGDNVGNTAFNITVPEGHWYRYYTSHVDPRYSVLQGYPFIEVAPTNETDTFMCSDKQYEEMFQTTQLGHWNVQSKANVQVIRRMPTVRESVLTT